MCLDADPSNVPHKTRMSKALCNAGRQGQVGSEQNIYYFALEIQIFCSPQGSSQLVMTHFLELNEE